MKLSRRRVNPNYYRNLVFITAASAASVVIIAVTWFSYSYYRSEFIRIKKDEAATACNVASWALSQPYRSLLALGAPQGETLEYCKRVLSGAAEMLKASDIFILYNGVQVFTLQGGAATANAGAEINSAKLSVLPEGGVLVSEPFKSLRGDWYLWGFKRLGTETVIGIQLPAAGLAEAEQVSRYLLLAGVLGVALAFIAAFGVALSVSRPLGLLASYAATLGKAEFAVQPPPGIKGEFALLGSTLHTMKGELNTLHTNRQLMLAQIAHEMRNPLGGIELLNNLAMEDAAARGGSLEYFSRINTELARLKSFLTSYLSYSKPVEPKAVSIPLTALAQDLTEAVQTYFPLANVQVQTPPEGVILFDELHLRQILLALLANGAEAVAGAPDGVVVVRWQVAAGMVRISVADNGEGVLPENLNKIFEPFFSATPAGTGLGLAIAHKLALANGAALSVHAVDGKYNNFVLEKPV